MMQCQKGGWDGWVLIPHYQKGEDGSAKGGRGEPGIRAKNIKTSTESSLCASHPEAAVSSPYTTY
jgi:hypothetical protein